MEFLGCKYSAELEELHNSLIGHVGEIVSIEDIREDKDDRFSSALGKHTRNPDGSITVKFNPDKFEEVDIAHEYLHAIYQAEGYPSVDFYGGENRDVKYLGTHIDDSVIHPLIFKRSKEMGFSVEEQKGRVLRNFLQSFSQAEPEDTSKVLQMQIRAFRMLFALQLDSGFEAEIRAATSGNLPATFSLFQEYKAIVPVGGTENKRRCQRCLLRLIRTCDSQFKKYGNEDAHLLERIYAIPVYISLRDVGRPAKGLVSIEARDRTTDGTPYYDICLQYGPEHRLAGGITFYDKESRDRKAEVSFHLLNNGTCQSLLDELEILYRVF